MVCGDVVDVHVVAAPDRYGAAGEPETIIFLEYIEIGVVSALRRE